MTERPEREAVNVASSDDDATRELVLRARGGDLEAAYDVLGRPFPTDVWVTVISRLALAPDAVDLEMVAHRTLRRPAPVVRAVIELAGKARTPAAAFLAKVIVVARDEEPLREAASTLYRDLISRIDVRERLADDDPLGALYSILARDLRDQVIELERIADDPDALEALHAVMRAEYERLQDVARDTRWRSGSYRHALRHAIADLALVGRAGGRLEEQAYRLLQQRADDPGANADLLELVSAELRRRYIDWSLERSAADASPARALFALEQAERHGDPVERTLLRRLLVAASREVAERAALRMVLTEPDDGSADREIAELLERDTDRGGDLVTLIAQDAPQRARVDLWPAATDERLAAAAVGSGRLASALARRLAGSADCDLRLRLLRILAGVDATTADIEGDMKDGVASVLDGIASARGHEIEAVAASASLRRVAWSLLAESDRNRSALEDIGLFVTHEGPRAAWERLSELHESRPTAGGDLLEACADWVADGLLDAESAGEHASHALVEALDPIARRRTESLSDDLQRLKSLVAQGDRAAEIELTSAVEALADRAIERSVGNERLARDYASLAPPRSSVPPLSRQAGTALDEAEIGAISSAIAPQGFELRRSGLHLEAVATEPSAAQAVRSLALIDQRVLRASTTAARSTAVAVLEAVSDPVARRGVAAAILSDLFERGPLFQAAIALSPDARAILVRASVAAGFPTRPEWLGHPVLGEWLRSVTSGDAIPPPTPDPGSGETLVELSIAAAAVKELERRIDAGRAEARRAFVAQSLPILESLEHVADTYVQFWLGLGRLGIRQVAVIGLSLSAVELDPSRHEIVGEAGARTYVVRSGGIEADGVVIRRARVEGAH